ncbi:hypothetical protein ACFPOU_10800 [Massilia jejuensis]|uniref:Response regulatory domain-containing protein n=1 Tax=Massilia jejuensis TaxID=648894 RepID=A0ABW0PG21_9BURK
MPTRPDFAALFAASPYPCLPIDAGFTLLAANPAYLRAQPATAGAVLIAVTGYGLEGDRQRTLAAGSGHHLVKPLDTRQLFRILEQVSGATPRPGGAWHRSRCGRPPSRRA